MPYLSIVLSVRERLDLARPDVSASSVNEAGFVLAISASNALFFPDSTCANDSGDENQIFGSSGDGLYSPRAIAIVRALNCSIGAIPTFRMCSLVIALAPFLHRCFDFGPEVGKQFRGIHVVVKTDALASVLMVVLDSRSGTRA